MRGNHYAVVVDSIVAYRPSTIGEGLAFIAGKGAGELFALMSKPMSEPEKTPPEKTRVKRKKSRKTKGI